MSGGSTHLPSIRRAWLRVRAPSLSQEPASPVRRVHRSRRAMAFRREATRTTGTPATTPAPATASRRREQAARARVRASFIVPPTTTAATSRGRSITESRRPGSLLGATQGIAIERRHQRRGPRRTQQSLHRDDTRRLQRDGRKSRASQSTERAAACQHVPLPPIPTLHGRGKPRIGWTKPIRRAGQQSGNGVLRRHKRRVSRVREVAMVGASTHLQPSKLYRSTYNADNRACRIPICARAVYGLSIWPSRKLLL
eukprot:1114044-Prorocentrum_minimum.AAC.2